MHPHLLVGNTDVLDEDPAGELHSYGHVQRVDAFDAVEREPPTTVPP